MGRFVIRFVLALGLLSFPLRGESQTLGEAVNATNLTWTTSWTGGSSGWSAESTTTHDGVLAAMSSFANSFLSTSTLQTTVTGPGTLTFWWYAPSYGNTLSFLVGSVTQASVSGSPRWEQQTIYLGPGVQTLKWVYSYTMTDVMSQKGYLDEVTYALGATAPVITVPPLSQSQVRGLDATFTVGAGGTPPLSYQWQFNGTNIEGATASSFTLTNVQEANLGTYSVTITNTVGTNDYAVSLEFGEVTVWGFNGFSEASVTTAATNVLAISGGGHHGLALRSDNVLLGWGSNSEGQIESPMNLSNVVAIAAGGAHSLALTADGSVFAWGNNVADETNVPAGLTSVVAIAAGGDHNLVLKSDTTVVAWGWGPYGQTNVPENLANVVAVAAGDYHSVALKSDGTVAAWGRNAFGLTNVPANLSNVIAIAAGGLHTVALKSDGTVATWGNNSYGQTNLPANLSNVIAIAAGGYHSLALRSDGTVIAWGRNLEGQTNVPSGLTNVIAIDAGGWHSVALVGSGPPVQQACAMHPALSGQDFSLSLPTQSGRVFALECRDSLNDPAWTALPLVAGNGGLLVLTDSSATNSQRFYRVRRW